MTTEVGKDIAKSRALLERGLLVAIPTETVYGLAANALDADAVLHIFEVKNRPHFDPLIVHGANADSLREYVTEFPDWAKMLADKFWPGPLTFVLPKKDSIPDIVTSGLPKVAVRVPNHPIALELLLQIDFPLAAPSANPFGYVSPTTAQHVLDQLGGKIPYILDGGDCKVGIESTIIAEQNGKLCILRLGGISVEEIESAIGPIIINTNQAATPGSMKSHYATRTPIVFGTINFSDYDPDKMGILSFQKRYDDVPAKHQVILSESGDLREASKHLFSAMRHLDSLKLQIIFAEEFPEIGLGRAINDRLKRAEA